MASGATLKRLKSNHERSFARRQTGSNSRWRTKGEACRIPRQGPPSWFRREGENLEPRGSQGDHAQPLDPQRARRARVLPGCLSEVRHHQLSHLAASACRSGAGASVEAVEELAEAVSKSEASNSRPEVSVCKGLGLLKTTCFAKTAEIWKIENVYQNGDRHL